MIATALTFFGGVLVTVIKLLLSQYQRHLDARFAGLEARLDGIGIVSTELKDFKVHVAQHYVHRDDFVRVEGAREVKLDRINEKINELATLLHDRRLPS